MRRITIVALCLVPAFVTTWVAASSASAAEPGWYECAKETGGKLAKGCAAAGIGYSLKEGVGKGKEFKGKGARTVLHVIDPLGEDIPTECESYKHEGTPEAPNRVRKIKAVLKKCRSLGEPCNTPGAKGGEIRTETLAAQLGYINRAAHQVGVNLTNEATPGGTFVKYDCPGLYDVSVTGAAIGAMTENVNKVSKTFTLTFSVGQYIGEVEKFGFKFKPLVNIPSFEGGPLEILVAEACGPLIREQTDEECLALPAGLELAGQLKGEDLEVKA